MVATRGQLRPSRAVIPLLVAMGLCLASASLSMKKAPGTDDGEALPPPRWSVDSVYTYNYMASSTVASKELMGDPTSFPSTEPSSAAAAAPNLRVGSDEGNAGRVRCVVELSICCGRPTSRGGWEVTASMRLRNVTLARDVRASTTVSNAQLVAALERGQTLFPLRSDGTTDSARFLQEVEVRERGGGGKPG